MYHVNQWVRASIGLFFPHFTVWEDDSKWFVKVHRTIKGCQYLNPSLSDFKDFQISLHYAKYL